MPGSLAAIGEVGLTGELRSVSALSQRLSEVRRLGFTQCLIPARNNAKLAEPDGLQLIRVRNIREALRAVLQKIHAGVMGAGQSGGVGARQ